MRALHASLAAALAVMAAGPLRAQTFQSNLWVTDGTVTALAPAGNTLYIGGSFTRLGPPVGGFATLSTTTGGVDQAPMVAGTVRASVSDGAGGRFIGGAFSHVQGQARQSLAHIDASGNVTAWNPGGVSGGEIRTMSVDAGTLYVGGSFLNAAAPIRHYLAAFDIASATLTAWNPDPGAAVNALAARNGIIYFGGVFTTVAGGQTRRHLAAVNSAGALLAWNPDVNNDVYALVLYPSPFFGALDVYVGGLFTSIGGQPRYAIATVDASSGLPGSWSPNGNHIVKTIALGISKGTLTAVYAGGTFDNIGAYPRRYLAQLDPVTGGATAWNPSPDSTVSALNVSGSTLYVGGDFRTIAGVSRNYLAAIDGTTGAATAWNPDPNRAVRSLERSGSSLFTGGEFSTLGGVPRKNLAALDLVTGAATAWAPEPDGSVGALALGGSTLYVGGTFTHISGQPRARLASYGGGGALTAWDPNASGPVNAIVPNGSKVYVGGSFANVGGQPRQSLAALSATTGLATSWNAPVTGVVFSLALGKGVIYVGGSFSSAAGVYRPGAAAINLTSGLPQVWDPYPGPLGSQVYALFWNGNRTFLGGTFTQLRGLNRFRICEVDTVTALPFGWVPMPSGPVYSFLMQGTTLYAGGAFTTWNGFPRPFLAAFDGTTRALLPLDASLNGPVFALAAQNGVIYAGGSFSRSGNGPHSGVMAMTPGIAASVEPRMAARGTRLEVSPNPSRVSTSLRLTAGQALPAALITVHDAAGRRIRRLHAGGLPAGTHDFSWDGADESGRSVAAGTYFFRCRNGREEWSARAVRIGQSR